MHRDSGGAFRREWCDVSVNFGEMIAGGSVLAFMGVVPREEREPLFPRLGDQNFP
jgi:hypothetical protein